MKENTVTTYECSYNNDSLIISEPFVSFNAENPIEEFDKIQRKHLQILVAITFYSTPLVL